MNHSPSAPLGSKRMVVWRLSSFFSGEAASAEKKDDSLHTTLRFEPKGVEGLWFIPFNGDVLEAKLTSIQGDASAWTASLVAPFGTLKVSGKGGFGGDPVSGTIVMGKDELGFEGGVSAP